MRTPCKGNKDKCHSVSEVYLQRLRGRLGDKDLKAREIWTEMGKYVKDTGKNRARQDTIGSGWVGKEGAEALPTRIAAKKTFAGSIGVNQHHTSETSRIEQLSYIIKR